MKIAATVLCVALGAAWVRPARAEEARPDFDGLERGWDAAETFRLNALGIVHEGMSGSFPTIFVGRGSWWRPVRGKFRWGTTYDDFYRKVGRDDLGERDRHRRALAGTLFWGGVIVGVGGLAVLLSGLASHHTTRAEVGLGMFGGGFVLTTVASNIQPPLVSEEEAEALARAYNRGLQVHLGLEPVAANDGRAHFPIGLGVSRHW
jgi:hypothetical protein